MLRQVLEYPDPRLRQSAAEVSRFDDSLHALVDDLFDTLDATSGIALCAPQLGDFRRVLITNLPDEPAGRRAYVNPRLSGGSTPGLIEESCLSVPGESALVMRHTKVHVQAQTPDGEAFEVDLEGMAAVCLQHEVDHLDGVLFVDRLWWLRRMWFKATKARALEAAYAARAGSAGLGQATG